MGRAEGAQGLLGAFKGLAEMRLRQMLSSANERVISPERFEEGADATAIGEDDAAEGLLRLGPVFCWDDAEAVWEIEKGKVFARKTRKATLSIDMNLSGYLAKADQLYRDGAAEEALEAYQGLEGRTKTLDFTIMITLGNLRLFRMGDVKSAHGYYQRAVKMLDGKHLYFSSYALLHQALCAHYLGEADAAAALAARAVDMTPDLDEARYQLAQYQALRGRANDAFHALKRLVTERRLYVAKVFSDPCFADLHGPLLEYLDERRDEVLEGQQGLLDLSAEIGSLLEHADLDDPEADALREQLQSLRNYLGHAVGTRAYLDAHALSDRVAGRFSGFRDAVVAYAGKVSERDDEVHQQWRRLENSYRGNLVSKQRWIAVISLIASMGGCTAIVSRSQTPDALIAGASVALGGIILGGLVSISIPRLLARRAGLKDVAAELKALKTRARVLEKVLNKVDELLAMGPERA